MVNKLSVNLGGIKLDNPVIPASGTFGFGQEMAEVYDLDILGSIAVKGTTREARYGNPLPRIAEGAGGVLNSVGLQNPGVDKVITDELSRLRRVFHKPIVANIKGGSNWYNRGEYLLSECSSRRHGFRHITGDGGKGNESCQEGDEQARLY